MTCSTPFSPFLPFLPFSIALAATSGGKVLHLKEVADVAGDYVKLTDVMETAGLDADTGALLERIYLGRSPDPGETRIIERDFILRQLALAGLGRDLVTLNGASRVLVSRVQSQESGQRMDFMRSLETLLETAMANGAGDGRHRVSVSILEVEGEHGDVKVPLELCAVQRIGDQAASLCVFELALASEDRSPRVLRVIAKVVKEHCEFFANKALSAHRKITAEDVESRLVECTCLPRERHPGREPDFTSADEIVGLMPTRYMKAGERIEKSILKKVFVVRKGDSVTVISSVGAAVIEVPGRALEEGGASDTILVENRDTHKRFLARVLKEGVVEHVMAEEIRLLVVEVGVEKSDAIDENFEMKPLYTEEANQ